MTEGRPGSAGAPRTLGGLGGHFGAPHVNWGAISGPPISIDRMQVGAATPARGEAAGLGGRERGEQRHLGEAAGADRAARRQAILRLAFAERVHALARDAEVAARGVELHALHRQQLLLEVELVAGVAGEPARGPDHAVTGHHDRQRVPAQRLRDGAHRARLADAARHTRVRRDGAIRDRGRGLQHRAREVAGGQPPVERPPEVAPAPGEVIHQIALQTLELRPAGHRLYALGPGEPRGAQRRAAVQVLDEGDAVLGATDEDVAERRREDAIRQATLLEMRQPRLEPGARLRERVRGRGDVQTARDVIDGAVSAGLLATRRAGVHVAMGALGGAGLRVPRRRGDEIDFDRAAGRVLGSHRTLSIIGSSWPLRPCRIFFRAWNTWARALSGEHSRLRPIASYSRSCSLRSTNATRCLSGRPSTTRSTRARVSWKRRASSGLAGSTSVLTPLTPAYARRRRPSDRKWLRARLVAIVNSHARTLAPPSRASHAR